MECCGYWAESLSSGITASSVDAGIRAAKQVLVSTVNKWNAEVDLFLSHWPLQGNLVQKLDPKKFVNEEALDCFVCLLAARSDCAQQNARIGDRQLIRSLLKRLRAEEEKEILAYEAGLLVHYYERQVSIASELLLDCSKAEFDLCMGKLFYCERALGGKRVTGFQLIMSQPCVRVAFRRHLQRVLNNCFKKCKETKALFVQCMPVAWIPDCERSWLVTPSSKLDSLNELMNADGEIYCNADTVDSSVLMSGVWCCARCVCGSI